MSGPPRLSDAQWARIAPHLPPRAHTGRPRANDRRTLDAIFFVLRTGCRWNDLPHEYGASTTAFRRFQQLTAAGVWDRIYRSALRDLDAAGGIDWSQGAIDGSFAPAKRGAPGLG